MYSSIGKDIVKLKGLRCGAANIVCRCLKKREAAGDLLVVPIDKFKASKSCCWCKTDIFDSVSGVKGDSVLVCKTCSTLWQHDVNEAKNMMKISFAMRKGLSRPEA
ncbi:hypothetical protein AB4K20DRAFT_1981979 [Rhizopus microsporus]|uniref:Uncharacterized protein n=1 Tax=Rhizopus microsporus TaxID=58291 RepID=A0A1X0S3C8_RHIZD|nr:hypothetical protein BCV71DRAFT_255226 [Rhizopus microsporus]